MNRPPPYFPQGPLSPPGKGYHRKFKIVMTTAAILLLLILGGIGYGIYFLISRLFF